MATTAPTVALERAPARARHARQPDFGTLVSGELFKMARRPMTKIVFGLTTGLPAFLMAVGYLVTRSEGDVGSFLLPGVISDSFDVISQAGIIALALLAASIVGSDYSWGTIRALVGTGVSRTQILGSKLVALLVLETVIVLASALAMFLTSVGITVFGGHDLSFAWLDGAHMADILFMFARTVFVLSITMVVAFGVSVLGRSLAAGIAVGIGINIADGILSAIASEVGGIGDTIAQALLTNNMAAITALNEFGAPEVQADLPNVWQATGVMSLYIVILLAITFYVFKRRDITSGS